jgi:hypothetical protein
MRDSWKARLEALEATRERLDEPIAVGHIRFTDSRGNIEDPIIALDGANDSVCERAPGESPSDFVARADAEVTARRGRSDAPPPILVLFGSAEEGNIGNDPPC